MEGLYQSSVCASCHLTVPKERVPCTNCGETKRAMALSVTETVTMRSNMHMTGVSEGKSKRNFFVDLIIGWFPSIRQDLSPKGVYLEQRVDRRDNSYIKKVVDAKTGRVIKSLKEKLTSHK